MPNAMGRLNPLIASLVGIFGASLFASPCAGAAVAIQPDGRIVVAGTLEPTVQRLLPNGVPDRSFGGGDGVVDLSAGERGIAPSTAFSTDDMVLQDNGKIAVLGGQSPDCGTGGSCDVLAVVVRLRPDGTRDKSFGGGDGAVIAANLGSYKFVGTLGGIDAQPDGKLLVTGGMTACAFPISCDNPAFLLRLNSDGSRNFYVPVKPPGTPGSFVLTSAVMQPDGKIVAAGTSLLVRLNANGSLDQMFGGGNGAVITDVPAETVALTADGKIMVGGARAHPGANGETVFGVERYTAEGTADAGFGGGNGFVTSSVAPGPTVAATGGPMRLLGGGSSVVASAVPVRCGGTPPGCDYGFGLVRFTPDGDLDPAFGDGRGVVLTALPPPATTLSPDPGELGLDAGARIVASGGAVFGASLFDPGQGTSAVAGFTLEGALDPGLSGDGLVFQPPPSRCFGRFGPRRGDFGFRITGTLAADRLTGTPEADLIVGLGGDDVIRGLGGDDLICASPGDDRVQAGDGDDRVDGGTGADAIFGGRGADELFGKAGGDRLLGGPGDDDLRGGDGNDFLSGGFGRDSLTGGAGTDHVRP